MKLNFDCTIQTTVTDCQLATVLEWLDAVGNAFFVFTYETGQTEIVCWVKRDDFHPASGNTAMIRVTYSKNAAFSKELSDKFLELLRLLGHGEEALETVQPKSGMQLAREAMQSRF